jgi:hypothetical protein
MLRFRRTKTLQKFASVEAQLHNHFNQECSIIDRQSYKERRSEAFSGHCQSKFYTGVSPPCRESDRYGFCSGFPPTLGTL